MGSDARCSWDEIEFEDEIIIGTLPFLTKQRIHPLTNANRPANMVVPITVTPSEKETDRASEGKHSCTVFPLSFDLTVKTLCYPHQIMAVVIFSHVG